MKYISPISLDLGGKYTGAFSTTYSSGEDITENDVPKNGFTVEISKDGINWSQSPRTATRHRLRGQKRRKLAKRLFWLILKKEFSVKTVSDEARIFLNGCLNRRGYTFLSDLDELDKIFEENLDSYFIQNYPDIFKKDEPIKEQLGKLSTDSEKLNQLKNIKSIEDCPLEEDYKSFKEVLKKQIAYINGFKEKVEDQKKQGNYYRTDYFKHILGDLNVNKELISPILDESSLNVLELSNIIGHIGNLQLRVLRKYFNDKDFQIQDQWFPPKLDKCFFRWIKSWHVDRDIEKENQNKLIVLKKEKQNVISIFTQESPTLTIPPYEDQNNRGIPKCMSLLLDTNQLDKNFPLWQKIADKLFLGDVNLWNIQSGLEQNKSEDKAKVIQRFFDRTIYLDVFKIRYNILIKKDKEKREKFSKTFLSEIDNGYEKLLEIFGKSKGHPDLVQTIFSIGEKYYQETKEAKRGLWKDTNKENVCRRCDCHPRLKKKEEDILIRRILGLNQNETLDDFYNVWNNGKVGRRTLKSFCGFIEEDVKKVFGNHFSEEYKKYSRRNKETNEIQTTIPKDIIKKPEYKNLSSVIDGMKDAVSLIQKSLNHSESSMRRYNNPFTLGQLYTILEKNTGGYSKTCHSCTLENSWRNEIVGESANAVSLAADSVRPFDGQLARILDTQAQKLAEFKIQEWKESLNLDKNQNLEIFIPIALEENRITFTEGVYQIKGIKDKKKKKKLDTQKQIDENRKDDKAKRIKQASLSICAYSGDVITNSQIDHIIPRSLSLKLFGTVLNSEANLIYVSEAGNQKKKNQIYSLKDLDPKYLQKQFGTKDTNQISSRIKETLKRLGANEKTLFQSLSIEEQKDLRHSLFLDFEKDTALKKEIFGILNTGNKTRINGTQAYLSKTFQKNLERLAKKEFPKWNLSFQTFLLDAYTVQEEYRGVLSKEFKEFAKDKESQGVISHIVDASMVFAMALETYPDVFLTNSFYTKDSQNLNLTNQVKAQWLKSLLPTSFSVHSIERTPKYLRKRIEDFASLPIFKQGIYGERFLSIILDKDGMGIGFNSKNCIRVHEKSQSKKSKNKTNPQEEQNSQEKLLFEWLKEFLSFPKDAILQDFETYKEKSKNSYLYFSIKKQEAIRFLQEVSKNTNRTQKQVEKANLLFALLYTVQKTNVAGMIYNSQNKTLDSSFIDDDKNFKIKVDWKSSTINLKFNGSLILPAKKEWEKLLAHPKLKDVFLLQEKEKELEKKDQTYSKVFEEIDWSKVFGDCLGKPNENINAHRSVRKFYSLPIIPSPSGKLFRIQRKTPDNKDVFQLYAADGYTYALGKKENGEIDFSENVPYPSLSKSKKVAPYNELSKEFNKVHPLGKWKRVKLDSLEKKDRETILNWELCLDSGDNRLTSRLTMNTEDFLKFYNQTKPKDAKSIQSIYEIRYETKIEEKSFNKLIPKVFGAPRGGNIYVFKISNESISFEYKTQADASMKKHYQSGMDI